VPLWVREYNLAFPNQDSKSVVVSVHERRSPGHHFINKDPERPPVDCKAVAFHVQNFWRQILSSSTKRLGILIWLEELGQPEICQFNVSLLIHQNVFRFQIPVDNLISVKIPKCHEYLSTDKLDSFLREPLVLAEVIEDIPSLNVFQEKVESKIILENVIHCQNERILGLKQDVFLSTRVYNLAFFYQDVFINPLHGVLLAIPSVNHEEHFPERSLIKHLLNLEIF